MDLKPWPVLNAQQIATELVLDCADASDADRLAIESFHLRQVIMAAGSKAKRGNNSLHSVSVAFREAFTLWKAVVRRVRAQDPKAGVSDQYFGLLLAYTSPELYDILMTNRVLLGYEPSSKEKEILAERKATRELDERMRTLLMESLRDIIFRAQAFDLTSTKSKDAT